MKRLILYVLGFALEFTTLFSQGVMEYWDQVYPDESISSESDFGNLVWSDEFDVDGAIDTTKWFHQTKLPNGSSWYNNEVQHYTNRIDNSFNDSGYLHIVAKREEFTDQDVTKQFTSARLNSKFAFTNGKVEIRAKLPSGVGTWPAMWTLGKNVKENGGYWNSQGYGTTGWPECGEIDIMEHWGSNQNYVSSAMHTPSSYGATVNKGGQYIPTASSEFHVYKFEWSPEKMEFSIDDVVHYIYNPDVKNSSTWPFDKDQYLLLNIAIQPNISNDFKESSLVIDYVRVYEYTEPSYTRPYDAPNPVYCPNPFKNELTIETGLASIQDIYIQIYNSMGSLVKTYNYHDNANKINLENLNYLSSGLYYISYYLNNKQYSLKVVKE